MSRYLNCGVSLATHHNHSNVRFPLSAAAAVSFSVLLLSSGLPCVNATTLTLGQVRPLGSSQESSCSHMLLEKATVGAKVAHEAAAKDPYPPKAPVGQNRLESSPSHP